MKRNVTLRATPEERFWTKVVKSDGCWVWNGAMSTSGYGVMQGGRRGVGLLRAHRFSYEIHHGPIADGLLVLHSCDNKKCVNPAHLSIGDHSQNIREAWARGMRVVTPRIIENAREMTVNRIAKAKSRIESAT